MTDLGIAKVLSGGRMISAGVIVETPSYMPPEQIEGRLVDGRLDQFSVAALAL